MVINLSLFHFQNVTRVILLRVEECEWLAIDKPNIFQCVEAISYRVQIITTLIYVLADLFGIG